MGRRSPISLGLALAVFLVVTQHTLAGQGQCRTGCQGISPSTFKYAEGTTYKYNYEGKIDITLSSAEGQVTSTDVKAQVLLTQQGDCNQILRLENVKISQGGKIFGPIPDIEKPVKLNFHDGHLEDSICVVPGDSQNSINIKRAIASMFQADLKRGHETDVFGLCPTDISSSTEGNVLVVRKSRSLNKCAYRENVKQDFLTTTFNLNSEIKSSPILNGDLNAVLKIKNGVLDQATVTEQYLYVPFSIGNNGAKAQVVSKLEFTGTGKDAVNAPVSEPRSIIFENPHPIEAPKSNEQAILAAVKETVKTIDVTVGENTAKEFVNLIKVLKVSKPNDILAVYNQVKSGAGIGDKAAAKKIFLDALMRAGNGNSVEVAITLLKNKELNALEQRLVYLGLSLVQHSTESAVKSALELLSQPNLPREAYLGIGNLAGRYCRQHNCDKVDAINKLTNGLVGKLGDGKAANRKEENDIIFVLKALANIKHLNDNILTKITTIAQDKKAPSRLRVVALETYLADACKDKLRDSALHILQDIQQDSEIRIRAYLALAQCPNAKIGNAIKALLEKEPSYQVGGFIVSHIRNIKASANPDKELAKQHLGYISLPKKFPIDPRKWSYNGEFSYSVGTLGLSNSVEANLIYSQKSFLPRATNLNLTAELFGHTFNFLEIETRQENLDKLIEHYFGPKGLLRSSSLTDLWKSQEKSTMQLLEHLDGKLKETLRARRDVSKAEIDSIAKQIQLQGSNLNNDLDLDVSVKAFGSELLFINLNDDLQKWTPKSIIDKLVAEFGKGIDKIKNFEDTLRSNLLFLDAEFAYPTSLGFPLRLALEGTSNVQVKTKGAIDVRALVNNKDTNVKINVIPSANIEIAGRLTLDALLVENGLKVVSTLYSATGGDLDINIYNHGEGVDVKFGLPVKEQKIISANHEIVFHTRTLGGREQNTPLKFAQPKDFSVCVDQLSAFIGLSFCAEINGPNLSGKQVPVLPFPLAGDAKVSVSIENDDIKNYQFRSFVKDNVAEIDIESIGLKGDKKVSLQLQASARPEIFVKATLISPLKQASAEGRITNTNTEKSVSLRLTHEAGEYFGKVGVQVSGSPAKAVYKPLLEIKTPNGVQKLPYNIEGQVIVEKNGHNVKYTFSNVKAILSDQKSLSITGNVGNEDEALFSDLTVSDGAHSASLKGRLQVNPNLLKFNAEVQNTFNPNANINIKGELKKQPDKFDSNLQIIHGKDLSSKTNILSLTNSFTRKYKSAKDFELSTKNKISYPLLGIDGKFEYAHTPKSLDYVLDIQYTDVKIGSELNLKVNQKESGDYQMEFDIWGLNNRVELKSSRQVQNDESKIDHTLVVNGKKVEVRGTVKHHIKPTFIDVGADLTIVVPTHSTPFKLSNQLKLTSTEIDAFYKVLSGSDVIVDLFVKGDKTGNANGAIKVNIKSVLSLTGQLKANKGSGNGDLLLNLESAKRQIKLESTFTIQAPTTYNVELTVYPSFADKKDQKIFLSTHNKVTETSVVSKNILDVINHKLEVNAKASRVGELTAGMKINTELEVTLPNEVYWLGKLNIDRKVNNGVINADANAALEIRKNKNTPGQKYTWKAQARNTNPAEHKIDIEHHVTADGGNGKNLNIDVAVKNNKNGDTNQYDLQSKVSGSVLPQPLELSWKGSCRKVAGQIDGLLKAGPNAALEIKATYDVEGHGKPISGSVNLDLKSPSKVLKSLKVSAAGSAKKPQNPTDHLELEGSASLAVDDGTNPEVSVKVEGNLKASDHDGQASGTITVSKHAPITLALGYSRKVKGDEKEVNANIALQYDQSKNIKAELNMNKVSKNAAKVVVTLDLPTETHKSNKLEAEYKRSDDNKEVVYHSKLTSDGKTWTSDWEYNLSDLKPKVDIKVKCPQGKLKQFYIRGNKISPKQFNGELKIVNENKNFLLEGDMDVNVENPDDFFIKIHANSPSLKINKVVYEIHNKPGKTGRRIQVTAKSAGQTILSGSTSYTTREENGKHIVEGSGSFKVKDETKSANFKYISQHLSYEKNGEQGIEISFDAGLGNKAIDSELKITNRQFRYLNSYCEEKKDCAHIEIDSKTNSNEVLNYNHELEIAVDLRKLGLSHEFGLKAVTNRQNYVLDHTVDVHFQNKENSKYQYSLYLHPKKAGVSLTTPKRIVAVEAKADVPKDLNNGGKATGEVVVYMDKKNQPQKKIVLDGWLDIDVKGKKVNSQVKFVHPALKRPLLHVFKSHATGAGNKLDLGVSSELDIFAEADQKLVTNYRYTQNVDPKDKSSMLSKLTIKSVGLKVDVNAYEEVHLDQKALTADYIWKIEHQIGDAKFDNVLSIQVSKTTADLLVKILNKDVLKVTNKFNLNKQQQTVDTEVASLNRKPIVSHLEVKNWNTVKYTVGTKGESKKLQFSSGLIPGQIADARADLVDGGNKQNVFHVTIKLDDANFLKTDYAVDSKTIETILKQGKERTADLLKDVRTVNKEWNDDVIKDAKYLQKALVQATPDLKPVKEYCTSQLASIKNELMSDKTIKEISETLHNLLNVILKSSGEIIQKLMHLFEGVLKALQASMAQVLNLISSDLLPQLKQLSEKLIATGSDVAHKIADLVLVYATKVSQLLEKLQPEFKQFAAALGEINQDFGRLIVQTYQQLRTIIGEQVQKIYNEIKALPIVEQLKEQYKDLLKNGIPNGEGIANALKEIASTLKDAVPVEFAEANALIDLIVNYLEKKLTNQPVNDGESISKIVKKAIEVVQKLLKFITTTDHKVDWKQSNVPLSFDFARRLPKLVAIRFSPFSHLLKDESEGVANFLLSLYGKPRYWVAPFPLYGIIVQGQHIFTFDGKHLTFPGKCNYLLARDAVNGNFSIVGTYSNGLLEAITLADKHDQVTLKKGGQVLLNNEKSELPVRKEDIAAYRTYEVVVLRSTAGVVVTCVPDLIGCTVSISGFYHGQIRGLLGNGNNEPYDDFTVPNGKIVPSEADFGNAYKTAASCGAVQVPSHQHQENPTCNKLFGWESPLRLCYPFVKNDNFKMACAHGLNAGVKDTELAIAKAYVAACWERNVPAHVPKELLKCTNSDKTYAIGDKFSVKTPTKAADVVLLVDTVKSNELVYTKLVQPIVQEISKEFHNKGINDVDFHLVAYGGDNKWPSHVTVGGKLTFKGKAPNLKFTEPVKPDRLESRLLSKFSQFIEILTEIVHDLKLGLGLDLQAQTYAEGLAYPFRANAVKTLIAVTSRPCEIGKFYPLQKLRTLLYKHDLIKLNLITPIDTLIVKDAKKTKDVVGFNGGSVFTLSQGKKKPEGSSELFKELQYSDYCVDFTVKNNGNVFVTDNFASAKDSDKTQFVQIAAHNIVSQLTNVEEGIDCECQLVNPYLGRNVCRGVYSKERSSKKIAKG